MELCVIEDHPVNLAVLKGVLSNVTGWKVEGYQDPALALVRCADKVFDLVIADYQMPGLNGIEVIARLRHYPAYSHIPIVMVTADNDRAVRIAAIRAGATDFLTKPVDPEELRVRAGNLLALRQAQKALAERATDLVDEVAAATRAIAEREEEIITRLARAIEYRDGGTGDHVLRVARVSRHLAGALGMNLAFCRNLYLAAQLHDTGKIGLPDTILMKTGRLTEDEITVMRRHTEMGGEVLRDGSSDLIRMAHDVALGHHERWGRHRLSARHRGRGDSAGCPDRRRGRRAGRAALCPPLQGGLAARPGAGRNPPPVGGGFRPGGCCRSGADLVRHHAALHPPPRNRRKSLRMKAVARPVVTRREALAFGLSTLAGSALLRAGPARSDGAALASPGDAPTADRHRGHRCHQHGRCRRVRSGDAGRAGTTRNRDRHALARRHPAFQRPRPWPRSWPQWGPPARPCASPR